MSDSTPSPTITKPSPAPTPTLPARGDKITAAISHLGADVEARGKIHHVGDGRLFVQFKVGTTVLNRYLNLADEGATWERGWQDK